MKRLTVIVGPLLAMIVGLVAVIVSRPNHSAAGYTSAPFTVDPYHGLGAWIDVFDYVPAYQSNGKPPALSPDYVDTLAAHGVRTLYIQAARFDDRTPNGLVAPELLEPFIERAHAKGMRVVGWYLPKFLDVDEDLARLIAIARYDERGQHFDGLGVDIEDNQSVPDPRDRNVRLLELSRRLRDAVGKDVVISAHVVPTVQLEVINPNYWPEFPWRELDRYYQVWQPMMYWTLRTVASGYQDPYRLTTESVRRMRDLLQDPNALVHPVGGIADQVTPEQLAAFVTALHEVGAIGGSLYDAATTEVNPGLWVILQQELAT
ncbi:MAG: hypothetical protein QOD72_3788 [Acidimicrobiaceae bacterium]|nr:hypothetical protein [Acidimicrobiaceae bacterium]